MDLEIDANWRQLLATSCEEMLGGPSSSSHFVHDLSKILVIIIAQRVGVAVWGADFGRVRPAIFGRLMISIYMLKA